MKDEPSHDVAWAVARAAADVIVELPGRGVDGQPVEMYLRRVAATGPEGFRMGSRNRNPHEEPIHRVVIANDFYLGTFVVTQEQWAAVWPEIGGWYGAEGPWGEPPGRFCSLNRGSLLLPVEQVSWYDAMFFCAWLSRHTPMIGGQRLPSGDWRFCLPTESEWEYACRGGRAGLGRDTEFWNGNGELALREVGWFSGNSRSRHTHAVTKAVVQGCVESHPLGLYGLHGNVCEWCHDEWDHGAYRRRPEGDRDRAAEHRWHQFWALGNPRRSLFYTRSLRVLRGGSWSDAAVNCRTAFRYGGWPNDRLDNRGFRVCLVRL